MDESTARGYINQLVYDVDFVPDLGEAAVNAVVQALQEGQLLRSPADVYIEAIDAVRSAGRLPESTMRVISRHDEASVLRFLGAVRDEFHARLNESPTSGD